MKTLLFLIAISLGINLIAQQNKARSQFVRGHTMILVDSLKGELLGEFPSKWDLAKGSVEISEFNDQMVIAIYLYC